MSDDTLRCNPWLDVRPPDLDWIWPDDFPAPICEIRLHPDVWARLVIKYGTHDHDPNGNRVALACSLGLPVRLDPEVPVDSFDVVDADGRRQRHRIRATE